VRVRFAIPGLRGLQQDFAVAARYVLRAALSKGGRKEGFSEDGGDSSDTILGSHVDFLHCRQAVARLHVDLDLSITKE
jgi:hypothetical protein